jgi:DNA-binding SARP family transcriptional activator
VTGWRLQVLGGFELCHNGKPVELQNRKDRLLLAYLALNPDRPQPRERLANLLWADRGEEQARGSLRQSLAALRTAFGEEASNILNASREDVGLRARTLTADSFDFAHVAHTGDLVGAVRLYRGPLLDGLDPLPEEYEEWLRPERQQLEDMAARVVEGISLDANALKAQPDIMIICRRLLARDPLREPVCRALMRLLVRAGDRVEALKTFAQCKAALAEDLGVAPAAETESLYREIQADTRTTLPSTQAVQAADERPSVAVMPFQNISRDPELDILCDGLAEDITAGLGRFKLLSIIDRHSSSHVSKSTSDALEVGKLLGAGLVVQGSLQKQQDGLRLTVRLVDSATRAQKWSGQFNFKSADILSAPGKVMAAILPSLNTQVESTLIDISRRKPALAAYEHLLIGIRHLRGYGPDDNHRAIEHFDLAKAADPGFALAIAYRAFADIVLHGYDGTPPHILSASVSTIRKASILDPDEARIWWLLGIAHAYAGDRDEEERCYRRSLELNASDANAMAALAIALVVKGRHDEGLAMYREAFRINPYHPEWYWVDFGSSLFVCGNYEEALDAFSHRREPNVWVLCRMAACYVQLGRMDEAKAMTSRILKMKPGFRLSKQRLGGWGASDAARFRDAMLKAGLPE